MNRWINLLTVGLICVSMFGCSMCCGPYDFDYPTFGGKHQRSDPSWGRVGSVFSDPGSVGFGPGADSNLSTPDEQLREAPDRLLEDDSLLDDLDRDLNEDIDMLEDLDRQLKELDDPNATPQPDASEPETDETTAARGRRQRQLRPGQRWR